MRSRGFTLLEVVVALSLGVIIVGAAVLLLAQVLQSNRRQHFISELQRDGTFASALMQQEIRQAGLGVPADAMVWQECDASTNCFTMYGTGSNGSSSTEKLVFNARRLLVATPTGLGIVGDLPRPDANYNSFGPLDNKVTPDQVHIQWHTESNGSCGESNPASCASGLSMWWPTSLGTCVDGTDAAGAGSGGFTGSGTDLTCAWSSRRIATGERLQIVDGLGGWAIAAASGTAAGSSGAVVGLPLSFAFDQSTTGGTPCSATTPPSCPWNSATAQDGPQGFAGQGFVTTLDRVFYHLQGGKIVRVQCWGDPDPFNAKWPAAVDNPVTGGQTNTMPASISAATYKYTAPPDTSTNARAPVCTDAEVIARNVQSLQLRYFDLTGTEIVPTSATTAAGATGLNAIHRVSWTITLEKNDAQAGKVDYLIEGSTALQNF